MFFSRFSDLGANALKNSRPLAGPVAIGQVVPPPVATRLGRFHISRLIDNELHNRFKRIVKPLDVSVVSGSFCGYSAGHASVSLVSCGIGKSAENQTLFPISVCGTESRFEIALVVPMALAIAMAILRPVLVHLFLDE